MRVVRLEGFEPPFTLAADQREPYLRRFGTLFVNDERSRHGSTGSVLHAVNAFGEHVAIKVHSHSEGASADEREQAFAREHDAHRKVSEIKGFPRLFGMAHLEGHPALVMEWIEGEPLYRVADRLAVDDEGRLSPLAVARFGRDLFDVLARISALDACVVHGDLSLGNVMVSTVNLSVEEQAQDGAFDVRIIDLSSAVVNGGEQRSRSFEGPHAATPEFAAPELKAAEGAAACTPAADVYAAASILTHLLYGRTPSATAHASGNDISAVLMREPEVGVAVSRAAADLVPAPSAAEVADALALVDEPLESLLASCLASDPRKRPSAEAMRNALASYCAGYAANVSRALRGEPLEPCTAPFIYKGIDRLSLRARTMFRVIGKGASLGLLLAVTVIAGVLVVLQGAEISWGDIRLQGAGAVAASGALLLPVALGAVFRGANAATLGEFARASAGVLIGGAVLAWTVNAAAFDPDSFRQLFFAAAFAVTAMSWCPFVLDFAFPSPAACVRKRRRALPNGEEALSFELPEANEGGLSHDER